MKPKILIGEMAKLHNVSAQTLRYYDKIGLFKPAYIDEENNYRYYGVEQFALLDSILFLRKLGMSIESIQLYFRRRNLNSMVGLLGEQLQLIDAEITMLSMRRSIIENKIKLLTHYSKENVFHSCSIKKLLTRKILKLNFHKSGDLVEFEYGLKALSNISGDELSLFSGLIGITLSQTDIINKLYDKWLGVALIFDEDIEGTEALSVLEGGEYACIVFQGPYERGEEDYISLLNWIDGNGYQACGDGILLTISDNAFSAMEEEYITEIQIPIVKKT